MTNVVINNVSGGPCGDLKVNRINDAYSKLRISGLTVQPSAEDLELALTRLENIMYELRDTRNICLSYNFEDQPDPNSVTNMPPLAREAISGLLAIRLIADFNKDVPQSLVASTSASMSGVSGWAARNNLRRVEYPDRQPIGSGNHRYPRWARFFRHYERAPANCLTNQIKVGETRNYSLSFCSKLANNETIISYTYELSNGLSIDNDVLVGADIDYTITADDNFTNGAWKTLTFTVTTDEGRVLIETVNFEVCQPIEVA